MEREDDLSYLIKCLCEVEDCPNGLCVHEAFLELPQLTLTGTGLVGLLEGFDFSCSG